jgi:exodeoxyribonuclease VII large subunit
MARSKAPKAPQLDLFGAASEQTEAPKSASPAKKAADPEGPKVYRVTELAGLIKDELRDRFGRICVQGEIADFKGIHRNGHLYCSLKDEGANMRLVMWRSALMKVPFELRAGLEVVVTGTLDYYGASGSLQLSAERLEPLGMGALQLKFEQLKEKLSKEGLFDASRKRPVAPLNWRIGLVTGKSTAALQDMLRIFRSRFPLAEVFLFHAGVQGERAPGEIVAGIESANRWSLNEAAAGRRPLDVLVVGRGGGSYEDLFCFNDEKVARALAVSKVPTVSAVGHEIDFTIADFVADKRAATPSHAAEMTVPEARLWLERLADIRAELPQLMLDRVNERRLQLDHLTNRLLSQAPQRKLALQRELLAARRVRLEVLIKQKLERRRSELSRLSQVLDALSPLKTLGRGFAVAEDASGRALLHAKQVKAGDSVKVRLRDGSFGATVSQVHTES